jgi:hypothetical protein
MFDAEKVKLIRPDIYFKQRPMEAKAVGVQAGSMNVAGLKPLPKGE